MSVSFFAPIAILMLLLGICLIVGLIVLLVRSKPMVRVIAIAAIAIVVLLSLGSLFVAVVAPSSRIVHGISTYPPPRNNARAVPIRPVPPEAVEAILTPKASDVWLPTVDKTFQADVYPSPRAAAKALARKLSPLLSKLTPDGQPPSIIQISGQGLQLPDADQIVADVAEVLRSSFETARVMTESVTPASPIERVETDAVSIRIDLPNRTMRHGTAWDPGFQELAGPLRAKVRGRAAGQLTCDVRFIDKPWVDDYATFISTRPAGQWLKAQSNEFAISQHEAQEQAFRAAAEMLSQHAWDTVHQRFGVGGDGPAAKQQVIDALVSAMRSGEFIVDKFAQRLSRSYGDVWREAILLDVSPNRLNASAQLGTVGPPQRPPVNWRVIGSWASTLGLVGFICVVYACLNLATKGYYAWSLRLTLMVIAAVGVMLVFLA